MNPFEDFCTDEVLVQRPSGDVSSPLKCSISDNQITFFDTILDITTKDKLVRALPNGKAERFDILDVAYSSGFAGIPASFNLKVQRQDSLIATPKATVNNISISNSHGFQVGDYNVQNVVNSFKTLIKAIDESSASPETKTEAKSRLLSFLEHPLTSAVLGGAVSGLL